jgi:hypothetical protein
MMIPPVARRFLAGETAPGPPTTRPASTSAQDTLARHHDLWQYVPYRSRWLSYFSRRALLSG